MTLIVQIMIRVSMAYMDRQIRCISLVLAALAMALTGCDRAEESPYVLHFDLSQDPESLSATGLIKDYEIYSLETTDDARIGEIDKVVVTDDRIYVLDIFLTQSVYVFDKQGKFLHKISRHGQGPGEYVQLFDMDIDSQGAINLLSRLPQKIMTFVNDGDSLAKTTDLERSYTQLMKSGDSFFAYQGNFSQGGDKHNLCKLSPSGEIAGSWFDIPTGWESIMTVSMHPLSRGIDGAAYFIPPYATEVYRFDGTDFDLVMQLDFRKYNMPSSIQSYQDFKQSNNSDYISDIRNFAETRRYYVFHTLFHGQDVLMVVEKATGDTHFAKTEIDDVKYFLPFGKIVSLSPEYLVTMVNASEMDLFLTGKNEYNDFTAEYGSQIEALNKRLGHVADDDNPLLIVYTLN